VTNVSDSLGQIEVYSSHDRGSGSLRAQLNATESNFCHPYGMDHVFLSVFIFVLAHNFF
jgi:hypothetical protein